MIQMIKIMLRAQVSLSGKVYYNFYNVVIFKIILDETSSRMGDGGWGRGDDGRKPKLEGDQSKAFDQLILY